MSDGSLSQDEIDALLQGGGDFGGAPAEPAGDTGGEDLSEFIKMLTAITPAQSSNLSSLTGEKSVTIGSPEVTSISGDEIISSLPDEVVHISLNFTDAVEGSHSYIISSSDASVLAGLMVGQEQVEMDEMALEALKEAFSTLTGVALNTFGDEVGGTIMPTPAEAQQTAKDMLDLPARAVQVKYTLDIEGEAPIDLIEVFEDSIVQQISAASAPAAQAAPQAQQPGPQAQPAQQWQNPVGGNQGGGLDALLGGGGQPQQDNFGGMMMPGQNPPNVQSVQFPSFSQPQAQHQESGNISLLMDVYMEMTVELGRTKKPIKEILGMGEGTIIELDKLAGEPVDILVNHKLIATGEVVVIDENFGVRVTEIVSPAERMKDIT